MGKGQVIVLCVSAFYTHMMSFGLTQSFGVIFYELQEVYHTSKAETTWVQSLFTGSLFATGAVAGVLLKKFGSRWVAVSGCLVLTAAFLASYFAPSLVVLYALFSLGGMGASLMHCAAYLVVMETFHSRRSLAVGVSSSGVSAGALLAPLLTLACTREYGLRGSFLILAAAALQALLPAMLFGAFGNKGSRPERTDRANKENDEPVTCCLATKDKVVKYFDFFSVGYVLFLIAMNFMAASYFIPYLILPDVLVSRGLSKQQASIVASCMGAGGLASRAGLAFLGDIKRLDTLYAYIVPIALYGILTVVTNFVETYSGLIVVAVLMGMSSTLPASMHAIIAAELVPVEHISVAMGTLMSGVAVTSIVGPPLAGFITDASGRYDEALYYAGTLLMMSAAVAAFVLPWKRMRNANKQEKGTPRIYSYDDYEIDIMAPERSIHI